MDEMLRYITDNLYMILDIVGTVVGLVYVWLEYKASIWLWAASIVMPLIYIFLYYEKGLYADFGLNIYYALAAIYGYAEWTFGHKKKQQQGQEMPITYFPKRLIAPSAVVLVIIWACIYIILEKFTNSTVPVSDSLVNALSIIGLWALARKYAEQWIIWIIADVILSILYIYKGIPFTSGLYALYAIIAVFGYKKWKRTAEGIILMKQNNNSK